MPKKLPAKTASAMDKSTAQDIVPRLRTKGWLAAIKKQMIQNEIVAAIP